MCSFLFTTKDLSAKQAELANTLLKYRGPDETIIKKSKLGTYLHNRLSITGNTGQPYVNTDVTIMFNGEIYNCNDYSELEFIYKCYKEYGISFAKHLDGEFSILITNSKDNVLIIATDAFRTKPVWYSIHDGVHVSTYKSAISNLSIDNVLSVEPNTTICINLNNFKLKKSVNVEFFSNQYKDGFSDIIVSLDNAIDKRTKTNKKIFLGLSSGYDSGCIAARLLHTSKQFAAFTIENNENKDILHERYKLLTNSKKIFYTKKSNLISQTHIQKYCELPFNTEYNFMSDNSSLPLIHLGIQAKKEGYKIFLSGTGSDEIIGDYYIKDIYDTDPASCFKGKFPENLSEIFPWKNFFNGTMRKYLTKDEYLMGCLGIETRYPFLDKYFVQEFLWLHPNLKNSAYKSPLQEYLLKYNFPFKINEKRGFNVR